MKFFEKSELIRTKHGLKNIWRFTTEPYEYTIIDMEK